MPDQPPPTAREQVAAILAEYPLDSITAQVIEVLLVRIEKQADAIVKLQQKVAMLDHRTIGSVLVR